MGVVQRIETCRKLWKFRSSSSWTRLLTCPLLCKSGVCRDCAENCGGSAVAVHRQVEVQTLTSGGYGGLAVFEGFSSFLRHFSDSSSE